MSLDFTVKCPNCKEAFIYGKSAFRPFCCERCKMIDLGEWLAEDKAIPGPPLSPEELAELDPRIFEQKKDNDGL